MNTLATACKGPSRNRELARAGHWAAYRTRPLTTTAGRLDNGPETDGRQARNLPSTREGGPAAGERASESRAEIQLFHSIGSTWRRQGQLDSQFRLPPLLIDPPAGLWKRGGHFRDQQGRRSSPTCRPLAAIVRLFDWESEPGGPSWSGLTRRRRKALQRAAL